MFDENGPVDFGPSAKGILNCLHMLAAEAALLKLDRTLDALFVAIEACAEERGSLQATI